MAWDDFANNGNDLQDNRSIIDSLNKYDAGKKVYEVEEEVTFIVKYKVIAKDKSELITNKPGTSFSNLDICSSISSHCPTLFLKSCSS